MTAAEARHYARRWDEVAQLCNAGGWVNAGGARLANFACGYDLPTDTEHTFAARANGFAR